MERRIPKQSFVTEKDRSKEFIEKPVGHQLKAVKKRKMTRNISFVLNEGEESRKVNYTIGDGLCSHTEIVRGSQSTIPKRSKRLKKCRLNLLEDK